MLFSLAMLQTVSTMKLLKVYGDTKDYLCVPDTAYVTYEPHSQEH